jgi:myo-inositol-1-phosphate synthase
MQAENQTHIKSEYVERYTEFSEDMTYKNLSKTHSIVTEKKVPKLGVMIVGLGGNNGSTFTAGILANKHNISWTSKRGEMKPNYWGSFTQSATTHVGYKLNAETNTLEDVTMPIKNILPMVEPNEILVGGWDISSHNLYESCYRSQVLEPSLIEKMKEELTQIVPLPAAFNGDFIAANQADRTNNILVGSNRDKIDQIKEDIRFMKQRVEKVIVLWSANTEAFMLPEIETVENLQKLVTEDANVAASVLYCMAAIEEKVVY